MHLFHRTTYKGSSVGPQYVSRFGHDLPDVPRNDADDERTRFDAGRHPIELGDHALRIEEIEVVLFTALDPPITAQDLAGFFDRTVDQFRRFACRALVQFDGRRLGRLR